jgi:hypothetical protein
VDLEVHGINGSVKAAEIEGRGSVSGVNGKVELTQVGGINKISADSSASASSREPQAVSAPLPPEAW